VKPKHIRVIAICLLRRGEYLLVFEGFDSVKKTRYYRPLGGGVRPGEASSDAVRLVPERLEQLLERGS
jgi:hypothetical protein